MLKKTTYLQFHTHKKKVKNIEIKVNDITLKQTDSSKFLGIQVDENLNWSQHIDIIHSKVSSACYAIRIIKDTSGFINAKTAYHAYLEAYLRYGITLWGNSSQSHRIFIAQKRAIRILGGIEWRDSCKPIFKKLNILTLPCIYIFEVLKLTIKNINDKPQNSTIHTYSTRQCNNLHIPFCYTRKNQNGTHIMGLKMYNTLPNYIRIIKDEAKMLSEIKIYLAKNAFYSIKEFQEGE